MRVERAPFVTIGICAYNDLPNFRKCMESVLGQRVPADHEIILVVGGEDGTVEFARELESANPDRVRVIVEEKRRGKIWAVNQILKNARGDVIVLLAGDAVPARGALDKIVRPFLAGFRGVVTGRPVPLAERGGRLLRGVVRFLWELHNSVLEVTHRRLSTSIHASAELMAFSGGVLREIPEGVVNDDAYIANFFLSRGFRILFEPRAVVWIKPPSTLTGYVKQRRRVVFGHLKVGKSLRTVSGTTFKTLGSHPLLFLEALIDVFRRSPLMFVFFLATLMLETLVTILAKVDMLRGIDYTRWELIK